MAVVLNVISMADDFLVSQAVCPSYRML